VEWSAVGSLTELRCPAALKPMLVAQDVGKRRTAGATAITSRMWVVACNCRREYVMAVTANAGRFKMGLGSVHCGPDAGSLMRRMGPLNFQKASRRGASQTQVARHQTESASGGAWRTAQPCRTGATEAGGGLMANRVCGAQNQLRITTCVR
jgi:hypothetical protein